jgi:chromosome segregation ATPase
LANKKSSTENALRDSNVELRDKVYAVAEMNREVEKVDNELVECQRTIDATKKEIQGEQEQIRSLQMSLKDAESRGQTQVQRLTSLQQEVQEADKIFKKKSEEISRMTEKEEEEHLSYVDELERELGMLKNGDEQMRMKMPAKKVDPLLQQLNEEVNAKVKKYKNQF